MKSEAITISSTINADSLKVWQFYTQPEHIVNWNFAHPSWHCPSAENDLRVGGKTKARMEAKDGSFGFDFVGTFTDVQWGRLLRYELGDREVEVRFEPLSNTTDVMITFDPENENDIEMQRQGWQAILDNFRDYVERKVNVVN